MSPPDVSQTLHKKTWHPLTALLIETLAVAVLEDLHAAHTGDDTVLRARLNAVWSNRSPDAWAEEVMRAWRLALAAASLASEGHRGAQRDDIWQGNRAARSEAITLVFKADGTAPGAVARACAWLLSSPTLQATQGALAEILTNLADIWCLVRLQDIAGLSPDFESWRNVLSSLLPAIDTDALQAVEVLSATTVLPCLLSQFLYLRVVGRSAPLDSASRPEEEAGSLEGQRAGLQEALVQLEQQVLQALRAGNYLALGHLGVRHVEIQTALNQVEARLEHFDDASEWLAEASRFRTQYYDCLSQAQTILYALPEGQGGSLTEIETRLEQAGASLPGPNTRALILAAAGGIIPNWTEEIAPHTTPTLPLQVQETVYALDRLLSRRQLPRIRALAEVRGALSSLVHGLSSSLQILHNQLAKMRNALSSLIPLLGAKSRETSPQVLARVSGRLGRVSVHETDRPIAGKETETDTIYVDKAFVTQQVRLLFDSDTQASSAELGRQAAEQIVDWLTPLVSAQNENAASNALHSVASTVGHTLAMVYSRSGSDDIEGLSKDWGKTTFRKQQMQLRDLRQIPDAENLTLSFTGLLTSYYELLLDRQEPAFSSCLPGSVALLSPPKPSGFQELADIINHLDELIWVLGILGSATVIAGPSTDRWGSHDAAMYYLVERLGITPEMPHDALLAIPESELIGFGIEPQDLLPRRIAHDAGYYRISNRGKIRTHLATAQQCLREANDLLDCYDSLSSDELRSIRDTVLLRLSEPLEPDFLSKQLAEDALLVLARLGRETEAVQLGQQMLDRKKPDEVRPELHHTLALLHFAQASRSPEDSEEQYRSWWQGVERFAHLIKLGKREYWSWPALRTMPDPAIDDHLTVTGDPDFWSSHLAARFAGGHQVPENLDQRNVCALMMYTMAVPDGDLTAFGQELRNANASRFVDQRLRDLSNRLSRLSTSLDRWSSAPISEKPGHLDEALTLLDQLDAWRSGAGMLVLRSELPLGALIGRLRRGVLCGKEEVARTQQSLSQENIRRTFEKAGFSVHDTSSPMIFVCMPTDNNWPQVGGGLPVLTALGGPVSVQQINDLWAARISGVNLALAISDHRAPPSSWEHIRTYAAADGFRIMVEDAGRFGNPTITEQSAQKVIRLALEPTADLFGAVRDPVTGSEFFGRKKLLEDLRHQLAEGGQIVGLFGLRKMGKSSVLHMLAHISDYPVVQVFLQDLEPDQKTGRLSGSFAESLWEACERTLTDLEAERVVEVARAIPQENVGPLALLSRQLKQVLDQLPSLGLRPHLLICLDEIEVIVPARQAEQKSIDDYRQIAGTLRDLAENDGRVSILVAGLNTDVGRLHGWGTRQNPLYQKVQERWLRPMEMEDCREMIDYLSQRMGLDVELTASEIAFEASGGWPFLARQLCSLAYHNLDRDKQSKKLSDYLDKPSRDVFRNRFLADGQRGSILNKHGLWGQIGNPATWGDTGGSVSQQLLEVIASQDRPVSTSWLTKEIGKPKRDCEEALKVLVERGVLSEDNGCYRIAFELFQRYIRREVLDL